MKIRKEIQEFAEQMERVMQKHDIRKGNSWKRMSVDELTRLLAVKYVETTKGTPVRNEYIDVANYCMLLYHKD